MNLLTTQRPVVNRSSRHGKSVWEFAISNNNAERTYALLVRTNAVETTFDFGFWDMGDWNQLMTQEAFDDRAETIAEHEPLQCDDCRDKEDDSDWVGSIHAVGPSGENDEHGFSCKECRALSIDAARAKLENLLVSVEHEGDAGVRVWLRRHWDAFELLFVPAVTL